MVSVLALPAAVLLAVSAQAATITVDVATDENVNNGSCSLREAITAANNDADYNGCVGAAAYGTDTIVFAIPGAGPHIISLGSALPGISTPMHIYGYSQSGSSLNNTSLGTNAVIQVGIANGGGLTTGFSFVNGSNGSSLSGLRVTGFTSVGVLLDGAGGLGDITISGNFIGTDGVADLGNGFEGIRLTETTTNITIGGDALSDRNVISGNSGGAGIKSNGAGANAVTIKNNLIGTAADGNTPIPNKYGIDISGGLNHVISGNVIGAEQDGVVISNAVTVTHVTGNSIGVGADGTSSIAGTGHGVWVLSWSGGVPQNNYIGGLNDGDGNVIANWGEDGVRLSRTNDSFSLNHGNRILGNEIYGNGGLGIELMLSEGGSPALESVGVTPNDAGDGDDGSNRFQNYPVVTSAVTDGGATTVHFTLDGAGSNYRVEFFSSPTCDGSGHGEGRSFLGGVNYISLDGSLDDVWSLLPATTPGHVITMTATDLGLGDTSEFSACFPIAAAAAGGSTHQIPVFGPLGYVLASLLLGAAAWRSRRGMGR